MKRSRHAFTLVEVVISVGIFTLLLVLVVATNSFFQRTFFKASGKLWQGQQAEILLLRIGTELREARSVSTPAEGEETRQLVFVDQEGKEISYSSEHSGSLLRRESQGGKGREVAEELQEIAFSRFTRNTVAIRLTLGGRGVEPFRIIDSVYLRNEGGR